MLSSRFDSILSHGAFDSVLIHSGAMEEYFLDDKTITFKCNPHFNHFVPLTKNPNSFIFVEAGKKPTLLYYQADDYWHGTAANPEGFWADSFTIKVIRDLDQARKVLPTDLTKTAYIGNHDRNLKWNFHSINPKGLMTALHYYRAEKTEYEQHCLAEANKIAARGHNAAREAFYNGASEFEIHLDYLRATEHTEADLPYGNIIALNENGAILHYTDINMKRVETANLSSFLIDAGAQYNGYAADITRTYSYDKSDEFAQLIDAMDKAQIESAKGVKVGVSFAESHVSMHHAIAKILHDFNFINLSAEAIVEKGISFNFFPHGLGHHLGLQVHDIGGYFQDASGTHAPPPKDYPHLRTTRKIEESHVVTIEPGLYFIPVLLTKLRKSENNQYMNWDKINSFIKYGGIRIEDDICVRADGNHVNFTRDAFAELEK